MCCILIATLGLNNDSMIVIAMGMIPDYLCHHLRVNENAKLLKDFWILHKSCYLFFLALKFIMYTFFPFREAFKNVLAEFVR